MTDAVIVHGGGRDPIAEEVVAGVRTVLRVQLTDEQRERIGISEDRDLALCVNRLCDRLGATEEALEGLEREQREQRAAIGRLREKLGATLDETFGGFIERLARERNAAVEPVSLQVVGAPPFWRAAGRPDLPLATVPAQAAQLAKLSPVKAATAGPDLLANLEETAR